MQSMILCERRRPWEYIYCTVGCQLDSALWDGPVYSVTYNEVVLVFATSESRHEANAVYTCSFQAHLLQFDHSVFGSHWPW